MATQEAVRTGLTEAEAARRRRPSAGEPSSRSYASIVAANVFTIFNLILAVFGAVTLAYGEWQDAMFLGILVANALIGTVQEIRAKRALDRLAALVAPTATVVRDGQLREVAVDDVVIGDLVRVQAGQQIVADGPLVHVNGLALDESILTGESHAVVKTEGEAVRSGSFIAEGIGEFVVEAVGEHSYAARITGEARSFRHPRSPLERALNRLLIVLVVVLVPLGLILGYALWERRTPLDTAVPTSVAAVVTLIPEGLILLTSLTYAVAALRIARKGALVQQLNAIESLASVDVICIDKTGTLTEPQPRVVDVIPAEGVERTRLEEALGRYAGAAMSRTSTVDAIGLAYPVRAGTARADEEIPFSSARRWSALRSGAECLVLGAPELFSLDGLGADAEEQSRAGRRVVALASGRAETLGDTLPAARVLGLVVIGEQLRREAAATMAFFLREGVDVKVLSGDRPDTVGAIAREAGVPFADRPVDGASLPADPKALAAALATTGVVGRISPEGKRQVVEALRKAGRYVAMVGDGVNDVPAMKAARLAIAQGSGTQMARSVADLVLVSGDFGSVPSMVAEGRKILRNLARVAKLFVAKSAFAVFLIVSVGLTPTAYPLLPRHLTLAATLTIGIPAFFLALAPSKGAFRIKGFLRDIGRFAVPAGTAAGLGVLSAYTFTLQVLDRPLDEARTVATTVLVAVGLYLILALESSSLRRGAAVSILIAALATLYVVVLLFPPTRHFYELALPHPFALMAAVGGAIIAGAGLALTDDRFIPGKSRPAPDGEFP